MTDSTQKIQIIWAGYELTENSNGFQIPSNNNKIIVSPLKETGRISCNKKIASCNECKYNDCKIFFNNYTGLFRYTNEQNNLEYVLVIHKKLCKLIGACNTQNNCYQCSEPQNVDSLLESYNHFFELFTLEIIKGLSEHLPFNLISPVSAHVNETEFTDNIFLKLLLIYQKRDEIRSSINHIVANPHRKIIEMSNLRRYEEVTYVDSYVINDILQHPYRLVSHQNGCINGGYSPIQVIQYEVEESFDTLENRYIKNLLYNLIEIIKDCIKEIQDSSHKLDRQGSQTDSKIEKTKKKLYESFINDFTALQDDIDQSLRYGFFQEVRSLNQLPSNSQVLMRQAGYRELFVLDRLLRVTLVPTFISGIEEAFTLKSMDTLWELYLMVKIIEAIKELGYTIKEQRWDERTEKDTDYDYASFIFDKERKEVRVLYQETIKVGKTGNYSLRPDFLLEHGSRKIVIDAKFMVKKNIPTGDISKYLTSLTQVQNSDKMRSLSNAVFAGCLEDDDSETCHAKSFTHLFNDSLDNECDSLKSLINYYLQLESCGPKEDREQYIGYLPIKLPI